MKKIMSKLKEKEVTAGFAVLSLFWAFLFLFQPTNGNILIGSNQPNSIFAIGLLLIGCSIILTGYSIKKE